MQPTPRNFTQSLMRHPLLSSSPKSRSSRLLFCVCYLCRFSPTRAPLPWDGVLTADRFSPVCPQRLPDIRNETAALGKMPKGRLEYLRRLLPLLRNQSEDCLYLNVFAPMHGKRGFFGAPNRSSTNHHHVICIFMRVN